MDLISPEDYSSLPIDLTERFVAFEEICRRNLNRLITRETPEHFDQMIRLEYMTLVAAAAEECGVEGFRSPWQMDRPYDAFDNFLLQATGVSTRFRLRSVSGRDGYSVRLANKTRGRIEQQIAKLRDIIVNSELPERQRKGLLDKLNDLSVELSQPRVQYAKVMAVLAVVCATLGGTTSFLAEAPSAVATITSLLGADKIAEDAETERLGPPPTPKALPPKPRALPAPDFGLPPQQKGRRELDDEIPF